MMRIVYLGCCMFLKLNLCFILIKELGRQTVPTTPEMSENPSLLQTPTLSTRLAADSTVIPALSKKVNVSIETLKAVIEKVLNDPNQPTNAELERCLAPLKQHQRKFDRIIDFCERGPKVNQLSILVFPSTR